MIESGDNQVMEHTAEIDTVCGATSSPVVSVVVPTYHRDSVLKRALLSLMEQTYEPVEIVVVDDNANREWNEKVDGIICSLSANSQQKIVYIKNGKNLGSAETRNIGIRASSGEYITFLDDDDIYLPDKIKKQIEHMLRERSDYCITDIALFSEDDKLVAKRTRDYIKDCRKSELLRYHLMHHMTCTDTMMFKRDYLLDIGGFPLIDVGDEFYLMQRAIEANGIFSYLPVCDMKAFIHTRTDGLSSGDGKIKGENELYECKKKYFDKLCSKDIRYIKMRHYAVLAFAEMRRKNFGQFAACAIKSFFASPISCARLLITKE